MRNLLMAALLFPVVAHAERRGAKAEAPENSWSIRGDYGTLDYHQIDLRGKFQLDETFDSHLQLQHERSQGAGAAGQARASVGAQVIPALRPHAAFRYDLEPNGINGFGFDVGLDWTANLRDEEEHETILGLAFASTTFRQKGVPADRARVLPQRFLQREWLLRWYQEVNESFSTVVFGALDSYASALGNLVNVSTDQRRRPLPVGNGTVAGFPHYSYGVGGSLRLSEDWKLGLDYARAEIFNTSASSDSIAGDLYFQIDNDWWAGAHAAYFRQDFLTQNVTAAGLSLGHEF